MIYNGIKSEFNASENGERGAQCVGTNGFHGLSNILFARAKQISLTFPS